MSDKVQRTIHIKWVRSGIGFDGSQSEVVRSLGLRRLNHVVERPDNAQVRGLVAKVAHLVEVVGDISEPVWTSSAPNYLVKPAASEPHGGMPGSRLLGHGQEPVLGEAKEDRGAPAEEPAGSAGVSSASLGTGYPTPAGDTPVLPGKGVRDEEQSENV